MVQGQDWSKAEKDVWLQIEKNWLATAEEDLETFMEQLHPNFIGWENELPMPDDRKATEKWVRYRLAMQETIMHELKPLHIQLIDNVAFVHYYYVLVTKDAAGKHQTATGRFTDVLLKNNGNWQFITWHGGETPD